KFIGILLEIIWNFYCKKTFSPHHLLLRKARKQRPITYSYPFTINFLGKKLSLSAALTIDRQKVPYRGSLAS
ncbi:hypothetical protein, partial [Treponema sp.]|uniref:hypothetical protein n=1 Tax=Treponema sp. TaxID=166 RepID=UPI00298EA12F